MLEDVSQQRGISTDLAKQECTCLECGGMWPMLGFPWHAASCSKFAPMITNPGSKPTNPKDAMAIDKAPLHLVPASFKALTALALAEGAMHETMNIAALWKLPLLLAWLLAALPDVAFDGWTEELMSRTASKLSSDDDAVAEPTWLSRLSAPFANAKVVAATGFIRGRNGFSFQWQACEVDAQGIDHPLDITEETVFVFF